MFKRKDWVFTQNRDTGEASSGSDDGSTSDGEKSLEGSTAEASSASTSSHSDASDGDEPASERDREGGLDLEREGGTAPPSMEALQALMEASDGEDGDDGGAPTRRKHRRVYSDAHGLDAQKAEWLLAADGPTVKGAPLRCLLCNGALLLNSSAFKAHMASKRHMKAAERADCGEDEAEQLARVVWAEAVQCNNSDGETHAERLVRLQEETKIAVQRAAAAAHGTAKAGAPSKRGGWAAREKEAKRAAAQAAGKPPKRKGKPGRRQRLAAKG